MRFSEAFKELQFGRGKRFALSGEEAYLKDYFIDQAKKLNSNMEFFSYSLPEDESEVTEVLGSDSVFGDRFILLRDFDKSKKLIDQVKTFSGLLIIVLTEDVNLKSSAMTNLLGHCTHVQCSKMSSYGSDYPTWLISKANQKKYLFVDDAEALLFKKIGPDMHELSTSLEKLMIYKEESKAITPDDVEKVIGTTLSHSTYDLLDNLLRKDVKKALQCFESYAQRGEDLGELVWFLGHYFEKMCRLILLHEGKTSPEGMADITGLPVFLIKTRYLPRVVSLGRDRLMKQFDLLCSIEVGMRSFTGDPRILIERFIFSFDSL